jgi:hypothetical protein
MLVELDRDSRRGLLRGSPQQSRVVGPLAQAAGYREDVCHLRSLDRGNAHYELDAVGYEQVAVGQRLVPLEVKLAAVDCALDLKADALVATRILTVLTDLAGQLDGLGGCLHAK